MVFLRPAQSGPSLRMHFQYCVHCHKWLCSPPGSAFLYARREVQHLLEPLVVSWGYNRNEAPPLPPGEGRGEGELPLPPGEGRGEGELPPPGGLLDLGARTSRFVDEQAWTGTRDPSAYLSVPAAIQFQAENDWPRVRAECHELLREARRRIEELGRGMPRPYEAICPDSAEWYAQMAAFPLPACDGAALQKRLYGEYSVEVPVIEWGGRQLVRVSMQAYDALEDPGAPVRVPEKLLPEMTGVENR
jgi:isopenicillin-N epimerase